MVYGNSRGFSSDVLITDVCGLLGYPTVTELLNLFADTRVLADAVVKEIVNCMYTRMPSVYSYLHY